MKKHEELFCICVAWLCLGIVCSFCLMSIINSWNVSVWLFLLIGLVLVAMPIGIILVIFFSILGDIYNKVYGIEPEKKTEEKPIAGPIKKCSCVGG